MTLYETLYFALHFLVFPAWALLIFAPLARPTRAYVHSEAIPLGLGLGYVILLSLGVFFGQAAPGAGMGNLGAVTALFSHPNGILTGWSHFLIYDLFIGAWIARDSINRGLSHLGTIPILIAALMFGPLGLLAHFLRRIATGHGISLCPSERD